MYKNILVPLDGSELAECVLPHVEMIAKGCGTEGVTFIRVAEPVLIPFGADEGYTITAKDILTMEAEEKASASNYLKRLVSKIKYDGVQVRTEVISGKAAESIAEYATRTGADLIVIATHGRSGISRWVWGSVADKILRSACVPVLMIRAPGCGTNIR